MNNYILVVARDTCELERKVNERLDSYEPLGGPLAVPGYKGRWFGDCHYLCQAMVRKQAIEIQGRGIAIEPHVTPEQIAEMMKEVGR